MMGIKLRYLFFQKKINMTIQELQTVLKYANIRPDKSVRIELRRKEEKKFMRVNIEKFQVYDDAIVLIAEDIDSEF